MPSSPIRRVHPSTKPYRSDLSDRCRGGTNCGEIAPHRLQSAAARGAVLAEARRESGTRLCEQMRDAVMNRHGPPPPERRRHATAASDRCDGGIGRKSQQRRASGGESGGTVFAQSCGSGRQSSRAWPYRSEAVGHRAGHHLQS